MLRFKGFLGGASGKEPTNAGDIRDAGLIPRSGRAPGGGPGNPFQYSCLENFMQSLAGYSPWGCKEFDTTECLSREHPIIRRDD